MKYKIHYDHIMRGLRVAIVCNSKQAPQNNHYMTKAEALATVCLCEKWAFLVLTNSFRNENFDIKISSEQSYCSNFKVPTARQFVYSDLHMEKHVFLHPVQAAGSRQ